MLLHMVVGSNHCSADIKFCDTSGPWFWVNQQASLVQKFQGFQLLEERFAKPLWLYCGTYKVSAHQCHHQTRGRGPGVWWDGPMLVSKHIIFLLFPSLITWSSLHSKQTITDFGSCFIGHWHTKSYRWIGCMNWFNSFNAKRNTRAFWKREKVGKEHQNPATKNHIICLQTPKTQVLKVEPLDLN